MDLLGGKSGTWSTADGRSPLIQLKQVWMMLKLVHILTDGAGDRLGEYKFTGLTAGEYAIVAAKEGEDFCYSPPITVTIQDESNVFEIDQTNAADITFVNNTSCEASAYNGAITIKQITRGGIIDDVTAGTVYNFDWIVGTDTASGSRVDLDASFNSTVSFNPNGSQVSGLPGDQTYSVIVTKQEGPATRKNGAVRVCLPSSLAMIQMI